MPKRVKDAIAARYEAQTVLSTPTYVDDLNGPDSPDLATLDQGTPKFKVKPLTADQIKQAVARYWTEKNFAVHFEMGVCSYGTLRADVVALNMAARLVIIEVKSSVSDFRTDKKWQGYAQFCNQFYFAMTEAVYAKVKDEIPRNIGVFVVRPDFLLSLKGKSAVREIDNGVRSNMVLRMAFRSANQTRFNLRAKVSGAELVADTAIAAIRSVPKEIRKTKAVREAIVSAISKYV